MYEDNKIFELLKGFANTIGTHTLTIMLHEYHGRTEEAEKVREAKQKLEDILRRLIDLYMDDVVRNSERKAK